MGMVLAAALGQIGLAWRRLRLCARRDRLLRTALQCRCRCRAFAQGRNGVADFIPVARISDMLLHPGESYRYNGQTRTYPTSSWSYWAGGNPFHHHQDLNRLRRAFARLDTLVVMSWPGPQRRATPTSCCPAR
jgi:biotin/methionine sulfoxide reductase